MAVFGAHCWLVFVAPLDGDAVSDAHLAVNLVARLAVVFFFVVSGFVIAQSVDLNRRATSGFSGPNYFVARCARILPPLLATVAITWILYVVLLYLGWTFVRWGAAERLVYVTFPGEQLQAIASLTVFGDLLGARFNGPLWSLVYEIRAYVLTGCAALALFAATRTVRMAAVIFALLYIGALNLWPWH